MDDPFWPWWPPDPESPFFQLGVDFYTLEHRKVYESITPERCRQILERHAWRVWHHFGPNRAYENPLRWMEPPWYRITRKYLLWEWVTGLGSMTFTIVEMPEWAQAIYDATLEPKTSEELLELLDRLIGEADGGT